MKQFCQAVAAVLVAAGLLTGTAGAASAATVVKCKTKVYPGDSPVYVTSVRGSTCAGAAREQRRYRWTGNNSFRTPGGYVCRSSGRGALGFQIRCTKGTRAYRIEFTD
jgi:hypothetical protein